MSASRRDTALADTPLEAAPAPDAEPLVSEGVGGWVRKHAFALIASLLVAAGCAWLLSAGALPVVPPPGAMAQVSWSLVALYALAFIVLHVTRCLRWGFLLAAAQRPRWGLTLALGLVGYGALVLLPFRLGEAARPALMHGRGNVPLGTSAGVVAAERIMDGLVLSSVLFAALLGADRVSPLPDHIGNLPIPASLIPTLAWGAVIVFGLLSLGMIGFYVCHQPLRRLIESTLGARAPVLARRAAQAVSSVAEGFRFLRDLSSLPSFAGLTAAYWMMNVCSIWMLVWAVGVPGPTLAQAAVILGVIGLGLVVPNAPGFFGTFQISAYSAMVLFYPLEVVTQPGAAFVFLVYVIQMLVTLGAAGVALLWLLAAPHRARPVGREAS